MARKQAVTFRSPEASYTVQRWKAAESCSLIGVGSVGKSNLMQHLADAEVHAHYWPEMNVQGFRAIVIDPNLLGPVADDAPEAVRCWAGYELLMHRLFLAYYPLEILGADDARRFYETYQALQDGTNPLYAYMGLRYFELGLEFLMRRGAQVVFLFDEFDEMMRRLPVKFFLTLRGLRDGRKGQLSYVTFTRAPLPGLIDALGLSRQALEPFIELFHDHVLYVGPYNEQDARAMLADDSRRRNTVYSEPATEFLLYASGRHAGLLRAAARSTDGQETLTLSPEGQDGAVNQLAGKPAVRAECRTLWASLSPGEQVVLKAVARLAAYSVTGETEQAVTLLVQKRLVSVDRTQQQLTIQPPLFRVYVSRYAELD